MPDANGIMTPEEIANLGVNALLKVRALKQNDEAQRQTGELFKQQIASGELEHRSKQLEFEMKALTKRLLMQGMTNPKTGRPDVPLLPQDLKMAQTFGLISSATPFSSLDPTQQTEAGQIAAGLKTGAPSGDAAAQVGGQIYSVDRQAATSAAQRAQDATHFEADLFAKLKAEGANANILSQGRVTDPANIARAFEGVTPTTRLHAFASIISASAQHLSAAATDTTAKLETIRYTADAKNKFGALNGYRMLLDTALREEAALANAGRDTSSATQAQLMASEGLIAAMHDLGVEVPRAAEPEPGFWSSIGAHFGIGSKKTPAGTVSNALVDKAITEGNLDAQVGVSPTLGAPPNAATPNAAPPASVNPPAAGAPPLTYNLPLTNTAKPGAARNVVGALKTARGAALAIPSGILRAEGKVAGSIASTLLDRLGLYSPARPFSSQSTKADMETRNALLKTILDAGKIPNDQVGNFISEILALPFEKQATTLRGVMRQMRIVAPTPAK